MNVERRVGFLTTCIADLMRPQVAVATLQLLKQAGYTPIKPNSQTCCGQPALNAGRRKDAKNLIRKMAREFSVCDVVVAPSGSCIGAIRTHMPKLYAPDEPGAQEVANFALKCRELSQFLMEIQFQPTTSKRPLRIAYHDSCAGLRELEIHDGPRKLLSKAGHTIVPLQDDDVCCGFGGTFAVKFSAVSTKMADAKCDCAVATGADVLAMGDLGCALNIEGRMLRRGDSLPIYHFAELLTGNL